MIGKTLRLAREKRKLSQKDVSRMLGLKSAQSISNIEREIAPLPVHYIPKLVRLLQIPEEKFIQELVADFSKKCRDQFKKHARSK